MSIQFTMANKNGDAFDPKAFIEMMKNAPSPMFLSGFDRSLMEAEMIETKRRQQAKITAEKIFEELRYVKGFDDYFSEVQEVEQKKILDVVSEIVLTAFAERERRY